MKKIVKQSTAMVRSGSKNDRTEMAEKHIELGAPMNKTERNIGPNKMKNLYR